MESEHIKKISGYECLIGDETGLVKAVLVKHGDGITYREYIYKPCKYGGWDLAMPCTESQFRYRVQHNCRFN